MLSALLAAEWRANDPFQAICDNGQYPDSEGGCLKCEAGGLFCPSSMMSCVNSNCTPLQPIVSP